MKAQIKIINFTLATKINFFPIEDGSHIADSILLYKLYCKGINYMDLGNDKNKDILPLARICYGMLFGKSILYPKDIEDLLRMVESGIYNFPTNLSAEIISFINMLEND